MSDWNDSRVIARLLAPEEKIDVNALRDFVAALPHGALVSFCGTVRPLEAGHPIAGLVYEWHETLASRELAKVVSEVAQRHDVLRIACAHRTGFVPAGEIVVAVFVSAEHRHPAFEACEEVVAELKRRVPIWKSPRP